jgi:rSAM/selenodomain-associated transferase 1
MFARQWWHERPNERVLLPMNNPNALLVIAKRPTPGQTKTRLTPLLTKEEAAALYECFLVDTLDLARRVPETDHLIAFLPAEARSYFELLAPDFELMLQEGAGLGERLDNALTGCLHRGYERVAIMNSDGPTLPAAYLERAFEALRDGADVALGPSADGGYYLIGVKQPAPRLLRGVRMSTPTVLTDTLALAAEEGLRDELLPAWYDVDAAADLARLTRELAAAPPEVAPRTRAFLKQHRDER